MMEHAFGARQNIRICSIVKKAIQLKAGVECTGIRCVRTEGLPESLIAKDMYRVSYQDKQYLIRKLILCNLHYRKKNDDMLNHKNESLSLQAVLAMTVACI
mmetsp:Transcript_47794/g.93342  ORF Transcript_47794/g.93342 Transcript_47794/m.93342 type:complete len:101 (+) Transcript_47794:324-626(+)